MDSSCKTKHLASASALFVLDSIADFLAIIGKLSSILSGSTIAIYFQMNQTLSIDYYANGDIYANTTADLSSASCANNYTDFITNVTLFDKKYTGHTNLSIADYISHQNVQNFIVSSLLLGIALKTIGNVLHLWAQDRKDESASKAYFSKKPSWNEYSNQTLHSILSSTATCSISAMMVSTMMCLHRVNFQYYYPLSGITLIDGDGFNRIMQVLSDEAGKIFQFKPFTIPRYPDFSETALFNLTIHSNIQTLLAFGAKIYHEEINSEKPLLYSPSTTTSLVSAAVSMILYPLSRFFKSKSEQERIKRLADIALMKEKNTLNLIDNECSPPFGYGTFSP